MNVMTRACDVDSTASDVDSAASDADLLVRIPQLLMLILPNWRMSDRGAGLGSVEAEEVIINNDTFRYAFHQFLYHVRRARCVPLRWLHSESFPADKLKPHLEGCASLRLLHTFELVGMAWFRQAHEANIDMKMCPDWAQGSIAGRSRETAITAVCSTMWRAASLGHSVGASFYDGANAFGSANQERVVEELPNRFREHDLLPFWQLVKHSSFQIACCDGIVVLSNDSGFLMGHSTAPSNFIMDFSPLVQDWLQELYFSDSVVFGAWYCSVPHLSLRADISTGNFVDDIAKVVSRPAGQNQALIKDMVAVQTGLESAIA